MKELAPVFPSNQVTIRVQENDTYDTYGGAHQYVFDNCVGFNNGMTEYDGGHQMLQFVKKEKDGTVVPGLQSEQVIIALIDRHVKLNVKFPSPYNDIFIDALRVALASQRNRVEERISRGTMGKLEK